MLNVEPDKDLSMPSQAMEKLAKAKTIALTSYKTDVLMDVADVLLPIGSFAETSGSFVNAQGDVQSFNGVVSPAGESRPAWKVLRVLGNLCNIDGFDYQSSTDVLHELMNGFESAPDNTLKAATSGERILTDSELQRVADLPIYSSDAVVRRSSSLQHTGDAWKPGIRVNTATAEKLAVADNDSVELAQDDTTVVNASIVIDDRVCDGGVWYPAGVPGSEKFSRLFGAVTLTKG